jgi:hypothetical protein
MRGRNAFRRLLFVPSQGIAGTVYGTIVVMATITAGSKGDDVDMWRLAVVVGVTVLVFWVAHVYSDTLAESLERGRQLDWAEFRAVAHREFAMPAAAIAPCGALVLGALHVLAAATAAWIALGLGVATLAVVGARYAMLERLGPGRTVLTVAINMTLGLAIVALKALVSH